MNDRPSVASKSRPVPPLVVSLLVISLVWLKNPSNEVKQDTLNVSDAIASGCAEDSVSYVKLSTCVLSRLCGSASVTPAVKMQ